ncbi:ATP-binding protein [Niveibacterium sp.]|uniref:sensor histidine kinase n=1 Tax=Niveibacterium sp. TaxID=2017444 RepID=UPI0035B2F309
MKIRGQLLVTLALVALVPLYVAGWIALRANEYTRTEQEDRALLVRAGEVAAAVDTFAAATLDGLRADSHLPALRRYLAADDERRALLISELVETLRNTVIKDPIHVGSAALLDRDGRVMVDTELGRVGASEADNLWFRQTVDSGLPSLAGPFFDAAGATLWASVPIHDGGGRVVGVLRLRISAARLQEFVRRDQARDTGGSFSVLFDSAGVAIAHGEDGRLQGRVVYGGDPGSLLRLKAERRIDADVASVRRVPDSLLDGVNWADLNGDAVKERVAVVALTTAPWRLALAEPASAYLAPYARVTTAVSALGLMVTLLIVGAAWLVSARIAKPIMQLTDAAERIGTGEQAILPTGATGEIGQLARAFAHGDLRLRESRAALEALNATLEARVQARTAELSQALERLQLAQDELIRSEKFIALGGLVAGIAHELNTPIGNSVTVASTLMAQSRRLQRDVEEGQLRRSALIDYAGNVSDAASLLTRNLERAHDLVASFKQVSVDRVSEKRREFDLATTVREIVATMAPMMRHQGVEIELDLEEGVLLDSYPGPLGQIITNFINNALIHAFEGRTDGHLRITAARSGATSCTLSCRDDGVGIPQEQLKRIFDPFFTTKLGRGGSGLGLSIVYNLVSGVLGGRIDVDSAPGEGACFVVTLPLVAPDANDKA